MRRRDSGTVPPLVYRATFMLVLGLLSLLVGAWFVIDALGDLDHRGERIGVAVTLLAGVLIFALAVRPAVIADEDRVLVRNPFRSVTVPWPAIVQFTVRYSLDVDTEERSFSSWAVSRPSWRRDHPVVAGIRPPAAYADQAAAELTIRLEASRVATAGQPGLDPGPGADVRVSWSRPMLTVFGTAAALLAVVLMIP